MSIEQRWFVPNSLLFFGQIQGRFLTKLSHKKRMYKSCLSVFDHFVGFGLKG